MALAIRRAQPSEAKALTALAHAAKRNWGYPEAWIERWRPALTFTPESISKHPIYVAHEDGALAGVAAIMVRGARASLEHLWVHPERAHVGIGAALLDHVCAEATSLGANTLVVESDPNAEAFYLRRGARRVGEVRADMDRVRRALPLLEIDLARFAR